MELLEMRLAGTPEGASQTKARPLYLDIPAGPPPLPTNTGAVLQSLAGLQTGLLRTSWQSASSQEQLGLLVILLVTRCGVCHLSILRAVLESLLADRPVRISDAYLWILVDVEIEGIAQKRRIFIDPATLAAMMLVGQHLKQWDLPGPGSARDSEIDQRLRAGWSAIRGRLGPVFELPVHLKDLMDAVAADIHLNSVPLLASYAAGRVASTSWMESSWVRMLGYESVESDEQPVVLDGREGRGATEGSDVSVSDAAVSEPMDADDFLAGLREATPPQGDSQEAARKLRSILDGLMPGTTRHFVAGWLLHLTRDVRHGKGKRLRPSTVNFFRATMASRLVAFLPERLDTVSGEELTDAFAELVDCIRTPALRTRVSELLRRFNAYCIQQGLRLRDAYTLPKIGAAEADISARHVTVSDFQRALDQLRPDPDTHAHLEARVFLSLAYRFGLRRAEILGLTLLDTRKGNPTCDLEIRPNAVRPLKTRNAERRLPLSLLPDEERGDLIELWNIRLHEAKALGASETGSNSVLHTPRPSRDICETTFLFLKGQSDLAGQIPEHPAAAMALNALRIATGDSELHLHHLRHAFGSRNVIGALLSDLPEGALPQVPGAIVQMAAQATHFHSLVYARAGRAARRGTMVSMALGHGSDETTYRHYVHGFDILVYGTLRATRLRDRLKNWPASGSRVRQLEAAEAARILGRSGATRPQSPHIPVWLANRSRQNGLTVCLYQAQTTTSHPALDLEWAKAEADLKELEGLPQTEIEHRRAAETLRLLRQGLRRSRMEACSALQGLSAAPRRSGWYVLQSADAQHVLAAFRGAFDQSLDLELRPPAHIRRKGKGGSKPAGSNPQRVLSTGTGPLELRVRDPLAEKSGGRQRHHAIIAWTIAAAALYVRKYPA